MLQSSDLAKLAWSIIDRVSADPRYADQLPPETWNELGKFMANVVLLHSAEDDRAQQ